MTQRVGLALCLVLPLSGALRQEQRHPHWVIWRSRITSKHVADFWHPTNHPPPSYLYAGIVWWGRGKQRWNSVLWTSGWTVGAVNGTVLLLHILSMHDRATLLLWQFELLIKDLGVINDLNKRVETRRWGVGHIMQEATHRSSSILFFCQIFVMYKKLWPYCRYGNVK